jgi:hypothetical protein
VKPFVLYFQPDVNKLDENFINIQTTVNINFFLSISFYYATLSIDTELLEAKIGMHSR